MGEALLLAVIFVYLESKGGAQFESFIDPLAIMFSLPLRSSDGGDAVPTGDTITIMSLIGLIL
jgi:multidrug efflux pump subunit AcrB